MNVRETVIWNVQFVDARTGSALVPLRVHSSVTFGNSWRFQSKESAAGTSNGTHPENGMLESVEIAKFREEKPQKK